MAHSITFYYKRHSMGISIGKELFGLLHASNDDANGSGWPQNYQKHRIFTLNLKQ